ncbi:response regulator transcription factor [Isoptericola sp. b441]|uniref:Response regulator transcription factor n=1 Tax=Actinotalea lenta TaxID=3064654 RepID=A0ABT9DC43_9CELL|nr:response regulator transcription factor [Isoptericola sp. b441]MDO8108436.1 response regulator transcription factor [Isoptericola sp. b441]
MKVLLLEDDAELAPEVVAGLRRNGFVVDHVTTCADTDLQVAVTHYDCLVLDRRVPDGDALDWLAAARADGLRVPALMLTARAEVGDRVDGFERGADDYLVKPFAFPELVVRVRALAQRTPGARPRLLTAGGLTLDVPRHRVTLDGVLLTLTAKEFAVLEVLMEHAGEVVTRAELVERCWDEMSEPSSNVVDVLMGQLRRRLGVPGLIETVRGVGYRLGTDGDQDGDRDGAGTR